MQARSAGLGDVLVLDVRVFHRAGVDGAHHVEEGLEYVVMDDPAHGPAACALTVAAEREVGGRVAGHLGVLTLPLDEGLEAVEAHESVAAVQEVREG